MDDLTTTSIETVRIMEGVVNSIRKHAERENEKGGYEAVGLLAGARKDPRVGAVLPLANHSATPQNSFFIEPWEQYRAEEAITAAGLQIRGVYHSHPTGEASPSGMDESLARPGELMVIFSISFGDINAWREQEGALHRVELEVVDPDEDN